MQDNYLKAPRPKLFSLSVDKAFLYCIVGGAYLSKSDVLPGLPRGVSIGDILLGCGCFFILIRLFMTKFEIVSHRGLFYLFLFWVCALSSTLFFFTMAPLYFTEMEGAKSLLKLSYYVVCTFTLIFYFRKVPNKVISNAVLNIMVLNGLIAIYIVIVLTFEVDFPYKFFWYGQSETYISNSYYRDWGIVVTRGTLSEPSVFGIVQNLGLAFLYFLTPSNFKIKIWKHAIIIISIALTLSLTAFFLLTLNLLFWLPRYKQFRLRSAIVLLTIFLLLFFMTPLPGYIDSAILKRVPKILSGGDDSTIGRLLGSWEIPLKITNDSPVFGAGLGNIKRFSLTADYQLKYSRAGKDPYNIFAYVLGATGIISFVLFLLLIGNLIKRKPAAGLLFAVSMFGSGAFLEPTFWIFYSLFSFGSLPKRRCDILHHQQRQDITRILNVLKNKKGESLNQKSSIDFRKD